MVTASKRRLLQRAPTIAVALALTSFGTKAHGADDTTAPSDTTAGDASTGPSKDQCVDWHKQSQRAQNELRLVEAREIARKCAAPTCPGLVINDCARWINDLGQRLPSVVIEVKVDGEPNTTATVTADGKRVEEWTRGEALQVDPGEHQFRVELGEFEPVTRKVMLAEGMRFRQISVEFDSSSLRKTPVSPTPSTLPTQTSSARRLPPPFFPLVGVGAAGIVSFGVFSLVGKSKQHNLEDTCKPNCTKDDLSSMKTSYLIGDISLGVGLASLAAAAVFYFRADAKPATTTIGFARLPGGGVASASYHF